MTIRPGRNPLLPLLLAASLLLGLSVGCADDAAIAGIENGALGDFRPAVREALNDFVECADEPHEMADLERVARFVSRAGVAGMPRDWRQRFCDAMEYQSFEYQVSAPLAGGGRIEVLQLDEIDDGVALVPHGLVIGGHLTSRFSLRAVGDEAFEPWQDSCIPIVIEKTDANYYLATLCRQEEERKFRFRYFRHVDGWAEIDTAEFPRPLAIQNLWDYEGAGLMYARATPMSIQDLLREGATRLRLARTRIAPERRSFYEGLTARMWAHLDLDIDFWAFDEHFSDEEAQQHALAYAKEHDIPVPLAE